MCAACDAKSAAPNPLASFDEELAVLPQDALVNLSGRDLHRKKLAIAKRNIVSGCLLIIVAVVVPLVILILAMVSPAGGAA